MGRLLGNVARFFCTLSLSLTISATFLLIMRASHVNSHAWFIAPVIALQLLFVCLEALIQARKLKKLKPNMAELERRRQENQTISVTFPAGIYFSDYLLQRKIVANVVGYEHELFRDYCTEVNRQQNRNQQAMQDINRII